MILCVYAVTEEGPKDRFQGNRKKLKSKKKAIQDIQLSSAHRWPAAKSKNPYADALGDWATSGADWPEGLPYGNDGYGDREVVCGQGRALIFPGYQRIRCGAEFHMWAY